MVWVKIEDTGATDEPYHPIPLVVGCATLVFCPGAGNILMDGVVVGIPSWSSFSSLVLTVHLRGDEANHSKYLCGSAGLWEMCHYLKSTEQEPASSVQHF